MQITIELDDSTLALLRPMARAAGRPLEQHAQTLFWQAVRREDAARRALEKAEARQAELRQIAARMK